MQRIALNFRVNAEAILCIVAAFVFCGSRGSRMGLGDEDCCLSFLLLPVQFCRKGHDQKAPSLRELAPRLRGD